MRKVLNIIAPIAFCLLLYSLTASFSLSEELIPPSRTLQDAKEAYGKLTVVSEPPGLNVFLDNSKIGKTPIWLKQVKPGSHKLRVMHSETYIRVEPNTTLQVSFFKGSFTVRAEKGEDKQPSPKEKRPADGTALVTDSSRCKYGYYEDPGKSGYYHCYYGGWGTHICETNTGLKECVVRGNSPYSCNDLVQALRARDCCKENFGGFSKSFTLSHCGMY